MVRWWKSGPALLAALGLYGCDAANLKALKPGVSTGFEVRERMGAPTGEWTNDDGSVVWEFARQPEGVVNFMAVIGPNNVLREIRQVLTEENFARVQPGMTQDQVRRLLGRPARTARFDLKGEEVWDWKYEANIPDMEHYFHAFFGREGRLLRTARSIQQRN